ncbi:hypothetical protein BDA99DRAFT_565363 [Phascolomyces articulosus]|uniref:Uncharacterized protein n=1 Tax=Phascolomyces articulosus TaxID=60185 RepID=A0AAD5P9V4_9FUNG|nr:hypothetical protein BDA99DRAFT_565363 [Phascolomyces articulosus]
MSQYNRRGFGKLEEDEQFHTTIIQHPNNHSTSPLARTITTISRPVLAADHAFTTTTTSNNNSHALPYWQQLQFSTETVSDSKKMEREESDSSLGFDASNYYDQVALNPSLSRINDASHKGGGSGGVRELLSIVTLPILNVIATCIFIGIIIYVYQHANGQSTDMTLGGMRVPTIVSLMMTILKMCVTGGIAYAVSEYKWVRLQDENGQPLALLDIYDACTRGVGGIVRIIRSIRLDMVLIPTVLFQMALIAMGPVSQQILTTANLAECDQVKTGIWYSNITSLDMTTLSSSTGVSSMKGLKQDYLVRYALQQAALGFYVQPYYDCPLNSINCTYSPIQGFHTTVTCNPGTLNTQIVDLHKNNVTTLSHYYGYDKKNSIFTPSPSVPSIFYSGTMFGRTFSDFNNYTVPYATSTSNNATYDAQMRKMFGDQKFVLVLADDGSLDGYLPTNKTPQVLECGLTSELNTTSLVIESNTKHNQLISQAPIVFDYDLLSNSTYWSRNYVDGNYTMMNAYAMQFSIIKNLVAADGMSKSDTTSYDGTSGGFQDIVENWKMFGASPTLFNNTTPEAFFYDTIHNVDLSVVFDLPNQMFGIKGEHCYYTGNFYQLNPAAFYSLALSLLIPLCWWAFIWIISLYKTNGVSRGNSQVALMVTGLTPAIREKFIGLSHATQSELFKQAKNVKVMFGETRNMTAPSEGRGFLQPAGHIGFGAPSEMNPIRTRRRSI